MLKIGLWYIICLQLITMLRVLSKECYCNVTSDYQKYPIVYQFMHNAFLGKVRLNQDKIIFSLKSY